MLKITVTTTTQPIMYEVVDSGNPFMLPPGACIIPWKD
jgi:hypothetical protein